MKHVLAVALCAALAATAQAQSNPTLFGLTFGKPIERPIPLCEQPFNLGSQYCSTLHAVPIGSRALTTYLKIPNDRDSLKIPTWAGRDAEVYIGPGGVVDGLMVYTDGVGSQGTIIDAIKTRFGDPKSISTREARNAMGASWEVTVATWEAEGVTVEHDCHRRDRCTVEVYTPAGLAARAKRLEEFKKKNAL